MTSKAPSIILHSANRDNSIDSQSYLPKLGKAHRLMNNSCETSLNYIDSVRMASTNRTPAPTTGMPTPKSRLAKKGSKSISHPKTIETDPTKIPVKVPSLINSKTATNKKSMNFSELMVDIYKNPAEKVDLFQRSFVSFKSLAHMQAQQLGTGAGTHAEIDEAFLPSNHSNNWKNQLEFNKKQEATFRKTIQEIFVESRQNFFKLVQDKEKRKSKMPPVRVGASTGFSNEDHAVLSYMNPRLQPKPLDRSKTKSKIPEYASRISIGKNETYKFYPAGTADPLLRKPGVREGATLTILGNKAHLYGGVATDIFNEWETLHLNNFTWTKDAPQGDVPMFGRYGHTADAFYNSIVIFGGEKSYNSLLNIRECLNDVRLYTPERQEWKYMHCHGAFVEPRRYHAGIVVGKHMIIHGGIEASGEYLSDLKILNLVTFKWEEGREINKDPAGIAFHKACLVLSPLRKEINLHKMIEIKQDENAQCIREEGIYFFGGRNEAGDPVNTLKVLKIGSAPLRWTTPVTYGHAPEPRYLHSMVHCRKLNMLVVHGGKDDANVYSDRSPYLQDYYILQLENLTWVRAILAGVTPNPRCSHCAITAGSKMLVFGGLYFNTYCSAEPQVFEMDQMSVKNLERMKKDNENKEVSIREPETGGFAEQANKVTELTLLGKVNCNYNGIQSFLPVPTNTALPRRLIKLNKMEIPDKLSMKLERFIAKQKEASKTVNTDATDDD